ncbi:DUF4291 family protein [Xanthomonas sontii]|uniref:DUF4291 family protein n=1 Tax=Xanthomonas sontii TaxID=2650745 RepID=UPI003F842982
MIQCGRTRESTQGAAWNGPARCVSRWACLREERILAILLPRACFDPLLRATAPSTFDPARFASQAAWKDAIERSDVRLQWDHDSVAAGAARAGPRAASQRGAEHRAGQPALSSAAAPHAPGARCKRCRHGIMHTAHDTRRA